MAVESDQVTADVIEVAEFPELIERYAVRGVPKTVVNATRSFEGGLPEAAVLQVVQDAAKAAQ